MGLVDRSYYSGSIESFLAADAGAVVDALSGRASQSGFPPNEEQLIAWRSEVTLLRSVLAHYHGSLYFEYNVPRLGRRIDVILLLGPVIFVLEFKVGGTGFTRAGLDQVWDYALDLKNFHEPSHRPLVAPVLVASSADEPSSSDLQGPTPDGLLNPIRATPDTLSEVISMVSRMAQGPDLDRAEWEGGRYHPTPTIIEAAMALYESHSVEEIARSDAGAANLASTSGALAEIIRVSREHARKALCFVTGVPGAGKTLVGLDIATQYMDQSDELYSVYLSGNGPLVRILCEALARDQVRKSRERGTPVRSPEVRSKVKAFIQNIHNFRDECLRDSRPPIEHVAIFDEAQRAWDKRQTAFFMQRKKNRPNFEISEPEYLISCLDRHPDWAVVICLVGGGQEINTGEAGIGEWVASVNRSYPDWQVYISPHLAGREYGAGTVLKDLSGRQGVTWREDLHLATSMRSFRAENVSQLVQEVLALDLASARTSLHVARRYPIALTRDLTAAKHWLRRMARGSERYGIVASSRGERLKPHAINVRYKVDPVHWFLDGKEDVRSSYYLEDAATEFDVQGLELDWTCVVWDADLRHDGSGWAHWSFRGDRWNRIRALERQRYLENAYRVLLTRARQGMVIVVPEGDSGDPTRDPAYYDSTYEYLKKIGLSPV